MKYTIILMSIGLLLSIPLSAMEPGRNVQHAQQALSADTMRHNVHQLSAGLTRFKRAITTYQSSFRNSLTNRTRNAIQHINELIALTKQHIEAFNFADNHELREYYQALTGLYNQLKQAAPNAQPAAARNNAQQPAARNAAAAPQPRRNANQAQRIKCAICFEQKNAQQFVTLSCHHQFCRPCLATLLQTASHDTSVRVRCPQCQAPINDHDRRAITNDHRVLDRFEERATDEWIRTHAKYCPNPRCRVIFESDPHNRMLVTCRCGNHYCSQCLVNHPMNITCQAAAERARANNAEEQASNNLIRQTTKQCPQCHTAIEKNEGCLHMTCTHCQYEFCWQCMRDWNQHPRQGNWYYQCTMQQPAQQPHQQPQRQAAAQHPAMQAYPRWQQAQPYQPMQQMNWHAAPRAAVPAWHYNQAGANMMAGAPRHNLYWNGRQFIVVQQ